MTETCCPPGAPERRRGLFERLVAAVGADTEPGDSEALGRARRALEFLQVVGSKRGRAGLGLLIPQGQLRLLLTGAHECQSNVRNVRL
jgi:hypothetical protein